MYLLEKSSEARQEKVDSLEAMVSQLRDEMGRLMGERATLAGQVAVLQQVRIFKIVSGSLNTVMSQSDAMLKKRKCCGRGTCPDY